MDEGVGVGGRQTVPRAELTAIVASLAAAGDFRVFSDCKGVVDGMDKLDQKVHPKSRNCDLWRVIKTAVQGREITVSKTKAHRDFSEVQGCEFEECCYWGNDFADERAKAVVRTARYSNQWAFRLPPIEEWTKLLVLYGRCIHDLASTCVGESVAPEADYGVNFVRCFTVDRSWRPVSWRSILWPVQLFVKSGSVGLRGSGGPRRGEAPSSPGCAASELGLIFVLDTETLLPTWGTDGWQVPDGRFLESTLRTVSQLTFRCLEWMSKSQACPELKLGPSRALCSLGYRCNSSVRGVVYRPAVPHAKQVASIIRRVLRDGRGAQLARRFGFHVPTTGRKVDIDVVV